MVVIVQWNCGNLQECNTKVLKIRKLNFALKLIGNYQFKEVQFKGICLKQDSVSFPHKKVVSLYIS